MSKSTMLGCCPNSGGSTNCKATVSGTVADINGTTGRNAQFCPAPSLLYTVTNPAGKTSAPTALNLDANNSFSIAFTSLTNGSYTVRIFSNPDACGTRYDASRTFTPTCTGNPAAITLPVLTGYDIINAGSNWSITGCNVPAGLTPTVSASGGTPCGAPTVRGGTTTVTLKVTSYPVSVTFSASADNCFPDSQTLTYNSCSNVSDDWCGTAPSLQYKLYPIVARGCAGTGPAGSNGYLAGATVRVTGGITGQATTGDDGTGTMTLSAHVAPKCGVTADQLAYTWTVTHPRTVGATYTNAGANPTNGGTDSQDTLGSGGHFCPMGGYAGAPAAGFACGGCPQPLPTTLHGTVLGSSVTLTYAQNFATWIGNTTFNTTSEGATPGAGCSGNMTPSNGPVSLIVEFNGKASIFYGCSGGFINQCPTSGFGGAQAANNAGCVFGGSNGTISCNPFLYSGTCGGGVSYRTKTADGSSYTVSGYQVSGNFSITE